jgi:hypothetical protein
MSDPLAELMQRLYRDRSSSHWCDGLEDDVRRQVEARFFRVLFEGATRSADPAADREAAFREELAAVWRADPDSAVARVAEGHGLRHWRFDPASGHIQMVFRNSIYEGDVEHRH